ncbi:uncharacterized protein LOC115901773 [Camarhynchus parvulus]|uniref:uncharacterized protein LOC115901773 n=1 Tax=Geospiza parvula TaxID=87175 RepID=UPI001237C795|nr:uncharacterized protein LOC115901773 [Camarhynchus parvulus]
MGRAGERRRGGTGTRSSVRRRRPPTGAGDRPGATAARARPPRSAARPLAQQCVPPFGTAAPPVLSAMVSSSHRISWERHVPQHIPGGGWGGSPRDGRGVGGAGAACTCADGPLTRKSVGGSGSRGAGPGPSRAAVPAVPGPASPRDAVQYLSLVLVAASAVCRGRAGCARSGLLPGGWEAPVQCGPVAVRPRLPQSELKPCRCLTYSGLSSPVVSAMRTWSCGLAAAGTRQAAPAPCSGTCKSRSSLGLPDSQLMQLPALSEVSVAANHPVH